MDYGLQVDGLEVKKVFTEDCNRDTHYTEVLPT